MKQDNTWNDCHIEDEKAVYERMAAESSDTDMDKQQQAL